MGQKVHPIGPRLGITEVWRSRWFERRNFAETLAEDVEIRRFLTKRLKRAGNQQESKTRGKGDEQRSCRKYYEARNIDAAPARQMRLVTPMVRTTADENMNRMISAITPTAQRAPITPAPMPIFCQWIVPNA